MDNYIEINKKLWNKRTGVHYESVFYGVEEFLEGKNSLNEIELELIGDVRGKSLFHLQCHFGMDTISWARLGATTTGIDFSEEAIREAIKLSNELKIPSRFILSDVFSLLKTLKGKFDIVFASYGALYWIPNIEKWIQIASSYLKRNGFLYIVDGHPFYHWLNREEKETDLSKFKNSYFDRKAQRYEAGSDYANKLHVQSTPEYGWHFTIGDLINACSKFNLRVNHFNEFPSFKLKKYGDAWKPIGGNRNFPVMFSIKATKE